jgi:hypothetical protein
MALDQPPKRCDQIGARGSECALDQVLVPRQPESEPGRVKAESALVGCDVIVEDLDQAGRDVSIKGCPWMAASSAGDGLLSSSMGRAKHVPVDRVAVVSDLSEIAELARW